MLSRKIIAVAAAVALCVILLSLHPAVPAPSRDQARMSGLWAVTVLTLASARCAGNSWPAALTAAAAAALGVALNWS
jgi:hypothetical protein